MRKKGIQNMDKRSHFGLKLSDRGPKGEGSREQEVKSFSGRLQECLGWGVPWVGSVLGWECLGCGVAWV